MPSPVWGFQENVENTTTPHNPLARSLHLLSLTFSSAWRRRVRYRTLRVLCVAYCVCVCMFLFVRFFPISTELINYRCTSLKHWCSFQLAYTPNIAETGTIDLRARSCRIRADCDFLLRWGRFFRLIHTPPRCFLQGRCFHCSSNPESNQNCFTLR